ncbi:MAG: DUF302 domain-containing protein [Acidobacteriota bacterium]|nr:DUF302 domain-containing protein [Acidobacteriota bacterium]
MMEELGAGMIHLRSGREVPETVARLREAVISRGIPIAAEIDHSGDAAKAGLTMRPTVLVIFGNPKAGTPLMVASPTVALDLPLKVLVWEDAEGQVWVTYNSPEYLQRRHDLAPELLGKIAGVRAIAEETAR